MPLTILSFDPNLFTFSYDQFRLIDRYTSKWVADAASTKSVKLDPVTDIELEMRPYPELSRRTSPLHFDIYTIGFDERKVKMNDAGLMHTLRGGLIKSVIDSYESSDLVPEELRKMGLGDELAVWMHFEDPAGLHV